MKRAYGCCLLIAACVLGPLSRGESPPEAAPELRTDAYGDPLPAGAIARFGTLRFRHRSTAVAIAHSPDGKALASADFNGPARLWDAETGKEIRRFGRERYGSRLVFFTPDGKGLVVVHSDGVIILYDIATGAEMRLFQGQKDLFFSNRPVAVSPNGSLLATGTDEKAVCLFELATGKEIRKLPARQRPIMGVAFSPDGKIVAEGGWEPPVPGSWAGSVRLYDVETGKVIQKLPAIPPLAFTPDGKTLAAWSGYAKLQLWDVATGKVIQEVADQRGYPPRPIAFSPDGQMLAWVDSKTSALHWWDMTAGREARQWPLATRTESLTFAPDGKTLATGGYSTLVRQWDVATGQEKNPWGGHQVGVRSVAFVPDGKTLMTAGWDGVLLWDRATGKILDRLPGTGPAAVSPDGRLVASGSREQNDNTIQLWDLPSGRPLRKCAGSQQRSWCLLFAPDGRNVISGSGDRSVRHWDPATGKQTGQFFVPDHNPYVIAPSPDGKILAVGSFGTTIRLWDVVNRQDVRLLEGHDRGVHALAFHPEGHLLASGGYDSTLRFWEVASGREIRRTPVGNNTLVYQLAFSPDGALLAMATYDHMVRLWEVATGLLIAEYAGHQSSVRTIAFAPDGRSVLSGSDDSTALLWDITGRRRGGNQEKARLSAPELALLWADLSLADAGRAQAAVWIFIEAAGQSEAFLKTHLQPVLALTPQQLRQLLADLDSNQFTVRTRAAEELEKAGELATEALQEALAGKPTLEVRQRMEQLLEMAEDAARSPGRVRSLRAVRVLEQIGSSDARKVLEMLATGAENVRLTHEAKAALRRLSRP